MIIYNVTIKIKKSISEEWLQWMQSIHIPDVLNTGLFVEHKVCKILHDDDDGGVTFAIQYFCPSLDAFKEYQSKHAKSLQADHTAKYKDQYVAFRTLMEVID